MTPSLWRHRDFLKLWAGNTLSTFGSLLGALSLTAILILDATPLQVALLVAAGQAPQLLFGLVAGTWADRVRRRPLLIAADLGRAALLGSIPLTFLLGALRIEQLYVVAFGSGTLKVLFDVAYRSYLPSLLRREQLIEANSKLTGSESAVEIAAFGISGWIAQWFTAMANVVLDALSFLASGLLIWRIRVPEPAPLQPTEDRPSVVAEVVEGLVVLLRDRFLRALAVWTGIGHIGGGIFTAAITLFGLRVVSFEPGILYMMYAVGGLASALGAMAVGPIARRFGSGPTIAYCALFGAIGSFFVPLAPAPLLLAGAFFIIAQLTDSLDTIRMVNEVSFVQSAVADRLLGRVNAGLQVLSVGGLLIGSLVAGLLGETIGLRLTLFVGASCFLVSGLWLFLSPFRGLNTTLVAGSPQVG
jgi:MFS family permease